MADASAVYDEDKTTRAQDRKLPVIEVFGPTIQGEGAMIGVKTMFVRMGGCDFRCVKCDSMHAVLPAAVKKNKTMMTQEEIGRQLHAAMIETGVEWVTISGGNPAIWDLSHLMDICQTMQMKVAIETQGTIWNDWVARCDQITLSPKSPGMGERFSHEVFGEFLNKLSNWQYSSTTKLPSGSMIYDDFRGVLHKACLKIVCFSQLDMDFALSVGDQWIKHGGSREALYLSVGNPYPPVLDEDMNLVDDSRFTLVTETSLPEYLTHSYKVMLEDYLQDPRFGSWKFLPQLHVLLWANKTAV